MTMNTGMDTAHVTDRSVHNGAGPVGMPTSQNIRGQDSMGGDVMEAIY